MTKYELLILPEVVFCQELRYDSDKTRCDRLLTLRAKMSFMHTGIRPMGNLSRKKKVIIHA
jgi:hypothetical protein